MTGKLASFMAMMVAGALMGVVTISNALGFAGQDGALITDARLAAGSGLILVCVGSLAALPVIVLVKVRRAR